MNSALKSNKIMTKQLICSGCGSVGKTKREVKGNLAVEIVLWLFFLIPGLIYSLWRQGTYHEICAVCGSTNLIPVGSPVGQKLLRDHGEQTVQTSQVSQADGGNTFISGWSLKRKILTGLTVLFGVSFLIVQIASIGR